MPATLSRAAYAAMFGPTTGDKVRLADTELFIEVERDLTIYGEEVKFGGGKVIRDGMGQGQHARADGAVDTVITNALIVDHTGIYKADVGLRDGRIAAIRPSRRPTSALTMPQWSTISALVMTVSAAPCLLVTCDCPIPSRITLPPPNFTSSQ